MRSLRIPSQQLSDYSLLSDFFLREFDFGSMSFGANLLRYKEPHNQKVGFHSCALLSLL